MPSRPARKPQNTYHHGDLREALVQAALREAEAGGPEAISLKALALELGVSQPAPYRHFADREALLAAVTTEAFRQFTASLRESIRRPSKRWKIVKTKSTPCATTTNAVETSSFTDRTKWAFRAIRRKVRSTRFQAFLRPG